MRERRKLLYPAFLMALLGCIAIVSVSYAWLGVSRVPFISDLSISAITQAGLVIAPDVDGQPGEWDSYLDATEFLIDKVPLRPVTYTPDAFRAIVYAEDGRTNGTVPLEEKNFNVEYPDGVDRDAPGTWATANEGYMVYMDFWMKTDGGGGATVFLSDTVTTADGKLGAGTYAVGEPKWDAGAVRHINGGYGMETTVRFGFQWHQTDMDGNATSGKTFMMYEPNADVHSSTSGGCVVTPSVLGGPLIDNAHLITQKASTWRESSPVLADTVIYTPGSFIQNPTLLRIKKGGMVKIRLYIWVEGQDIDCLARDVSEAVSILANFQFGVSPDAQDSTGIGRRDLSKITGD